jgi:hypothetical protein
MKAEEVFNLTPREKNATLLKSIANKASEICEGKV